MATTPTPGAGAPAPASPQPQGGTNPLQIIAAITRLAQMLAQTASATSPDAEEIIKNVQNAARKLMPTQPDQKSPSPF